MSLVKVFVNVDKLRAENKIANEIRVFIVGQSWPMRILLQNQTDGTSNLSHEEEQSTVLCLSFTVHQATRVNLETLRPSSRFHLSLLFREGSVLLGPHLRIWPNMIASEYPKCARATFCMD